MTLIAAFLTIPLYFTRALGRYVTMAVIGFIPILSLFAIFGPLWDAENRAFHDDIVHTRVVVVR